jgi:capsular polysaccharide transport system permease protein
MALPTRASPLSSLTTRGGPIAALPRPIRARSGAGRLLAVASFVLVFLIPSCAAVGFFGFWQSDQYVAEARFTIRPAAAPGATVTEVPTELIVQDTMIAMTYLRSRALVERLEQDVGLRQLYDRDSIDWFDRLKPKAEVEDVLRYWHAMSAVSVQATNGIVTLTVRAFAPGDAAAIAEACLKAAEAEVNRLDQQAVASTVAAVEAARKNAETGLAAARANLEATRNSEAVIDSEQSTTALTALITSVRKDYMTLQQQYDSQSRYLDKNSPQIRNMAIKLDAAKHEIARLESQLTGRQQMAPSRPALSDSMAKLEYADLRNRVAEAQYDAAISQAEAAQLAAKAQAIYLQVFLHPAPAQEPKYPRRLTWSAVSVFAFLCAWIAAMIGLSQHRRRGATA